MYLEHYGLREPPFSITPDPRFVFLSERHRDALAHLSHGVGQGGGSGFVQLTGEVGTGKTTISRLLLEQLPENTRIALILNPLLSPVELLEAIGEELRLDLDGKRGSLKALVDALNIFLLDAYAAGLRVVLIIDEAQNLSAAALEQVRLLTNLETPTQKLLQIILLGQPELRDQLARPELRQLAQRITARYHLDPLDADESEAYLRHRWAVAGGGNFPFTRPAVRRLHRHAGGVPRLLNVIAERALLAGYARGETTIGENLLDEAAAEVLAPRRSAPRIPLVVGAIVLVALGALAFWKWPHAHSAPLHVAAIKRPAIARLPAPPPAYALLGADAFTQRLVANDGKAQPAWARLLALWNVHSQESGNATAASCTPVLAPGLFCASGTTRLSRLAQFDRPAILRLRANGRTVSALLLGLGSTEALLQVDGDAFRVRRVVLEESLIGYAAIWRGPDALTLPLKSGDTGAGVEWLRDRLLPSNASVAASTSATYDAELIAAVRDVQRDFGLHGDGVVGQETLLALMATDRSGPHLRKLPE